MKSDSSLSNWSRERNDIYRTGYYRRRSLVSGSYIQVTQTRIKASPSRHLSTTLTAKYSFNTIHHTLCVSSLFTNEDFSANTVSSWNQNSFNLCVEAGGNPSWKNIGWPFNTSTHPGSQEKAAESDWVMAFCNINYSSWLLFFPSKQLSSYHCNSSAIIQYFISLFNGYWRKY